MTPSRAAGALVTRVWSAAEPHMFATVYEEDDEAFDL